MRSPPRKPTASGSSKSSFHSKTPDGAGTSPAPPFFVSCATTKGRDSRRSQRGYSLCSRRGSSPRGQGEGVFGAKPPPHRPPPETWGDATLHRHGDTIPGPDGPPIVGDHFLESTSLYPPPAALWLSPLEIPPKERRGGEQQWKEKQRTSYLQHLCAKDFLVRGRTDLRFEYSAAGRGVSSLVGSAWRPTPVLGELTDKAVNSSLTFFFSTVHGAFSF